MRIVVSRSGGVAGMTRRAEVDTEVRADAAWWRETVAVAVPLPPAVTSAAGTSAASRGASRVRDAFTWTIELGEHRAVLPDSAVSGPLREIAERTLAEGGPPR